MPVLLSIAKWWRANFAAEPSREKEKVLRTLDEASVYRTTHNGWVSPLKRDDILPDDDPVLKEFAGGEQHGFYRRIRRQTPSISGFFKLRSHAVMHLPHAWVAGDPDNAQSVRIRAETEAAWDRVQDRDVSMLKALDCIPDGVTLGLLAWEPVDIAVKIVDPETGATTIERSTLAVPTKIIDREQNFDFRVNGEVVLTKYGRAVQPLDLLQYIVARYGSAKLHGRPEMIDVYPIAWKMDLVERMQLEALGKQGYPLVINTLPEGTDSEIVAQRYNHLKAQYPNVIVQTGGDRETWETPNANLSPTLVGSDSFTRLNQLKDEASISILGVAFSNGQAGSFARDQVRDSMRFEKTGVDAGCYDTFANEWADRFAAVNYPGVDKTLLARMVTDNKPTEDLKSWTENTVAMVTAGMGNVDGVAAAEFLGIPLTDDPARVLRASNATATRTTADAKDQLSDGPDASLIPSLPDGRKEPTDQPDVTAGGEVKSGIATKLTMNGEQIKSGIEVIKQIRADGIGHTAAVAFLTGIGVENGVAEQIHTEEAKAAKEAPPEPNPVPPQFQRDNTATVMSESGVLYEMAEFNAAENLIRLTPRSN